MRVRVRVRARARAQLRLRVRVRARRTSAEAAAELGEGSRLERGAAGYPPLAEGAASAPRLDGAASERGAISIEGVPVARFHLELELDLNVLRWHARRGGRGGRGGQAKLRARPRKGGGGQSGPRQCGGGPLQLLTEDLDLGDIERARVTPLHEHVLPHLGARG